MSGSYREEQVRGTFRLYNGERLGNRRALFVLTEPERRPTLVYVARWFGRELELQLTFITIYQQPVPALSNFEFAFRSRFLDSPCGGTWTVTGFFGTGTTVASRGATACP